MSVTWDILIPSLNSRAKLLDSLLDCLASQIVSDVGVVVYQDNAEVSCAHKCNVLTESTEADYVSFIDDDDDVVVDFIPTILEALAERPDYVGFRVLYTEKGVPQVPVWHSLQYPGPWTNTPAGNFRDIQQFNPIRRELALMSPWKGGYDADRIRADRLRELGVVKTEVFIDRAMYHYRHDVSLTFSPDRANKLTTDHVPSRRNEPWLVWI